MDTKEMFHALTDDEIKAVEKFRVLVSLFNWKAGQMSDADMEPTNKAMFSQYVQAGIDVLGVLGRLDDTIMKASFVLYEHLFADDVRTDEKINQFLEWQKSQVGE